MGICFFSTVIGCINMFPSLLDYGMFGALFLRVGLAVVFIVHGYPKLFKNFDETAQWFSSIGIVPGKFWASVVGIVEFFGGIFLLIGMFVQPVAMLLAINMIVAIVKVKFSKGFVGGYEFELMLLIMALALVVLGAGAYAIDLPF